MENSNKTLKVILITLILGPLIYYSYKYTFQITGPYCGKWLILLFKEIETSPNLVAFKTNLGLNFVSSILISIPLSSFICYLIKPKSIKILTLPIFIFFLMSYGPFLISLQHNSMGNYPELALIDIISRPFITTFLFIVLFKVQLIISLTRSSCRPLGLGISLDDSRHKS